VLAGRVHRDVDDLATRRPTVLVTGSWLTVKEQMADRYAAVLAARGFTAVTFDFTGFGGSDGAPRQAELASRKIADLVAVTEQLRTLSFVAPGGIGQLAVCASAQYSLRAIEQRAPIAALASVAGWFHDAATVAPFYGGPEGVADRLKRAAEALTAYQAGGELRTVPAYAEGDDRAGMSLPLDYYGSAGRGAVPSWINEMAELSWLSWLTFDGLSGAEDIDVPTLFVHSDDCVLPDNVRALADRMPRTDLVWAAGTQIDFYDQEPQVTLAVDAAEQHFRTYLPSAQEDR
jgi:fermentation-respiration switch protein FrsA (DUF1100 family)